MHTNAQCVYLADSIRHSKSDDVAFVPARSWSVMNVTDRTKKVLILFLVLLGSLIAFAMIMRGRTDRTGASFVETAIVFSAEDDNSVIIEPTT